MVRLRIIHAFGTRLISVVQILGRYTYYFHAKSLDKQRIGRTSPCNQKIILGNNLGTTPWYSVEKPNLGATVAYTETNIIQINMLPGMAITWYFVQMLVTKAAFPSTVARTAVYKAVPHTQCPAVFPSLCGRSFHQMASEQIYKIKEW